MTFQQQKGVTSFRLLLHPHCGRNLLINSVGWAFQVVGGMAAQKAGGRCRNETGRAEAIRIQRGITSQLPHQYRRDDGRSSHIPSGSTSVPQVATGHLRGALEGRSEILPVPRNRKFSEVSNHPKEGPRRVESTHVRELREGKKQASNSGSCTVVGSGERGRRGEGGGEAVRKTRAAKGTVEK